MNIPLAKKSLKYEGIAVRVNPSTKASGKDRGSVAHRYAELHGGRLRATDESLTLPPRYKGLVHVER
jgi:hypothetical protein